MPEGGVDIYEATNGTGYVVTAQSKGYGGMLKVMVGIDSNGVITGTEVLENYETQGLGSKVSEHAFMDQYIGKDSNLEGLETISGTTISSNAFTQAVRNAFAVYGEAAGVEVAGVEREPITDEVKAELFPNVTSFQKYAVEGEAYKAGDDGLHRCNQQRRICRKCNHCHWFRSERRHTAWYSPKQVKPRITANSIPVLPGRMLRWARLRQMNWI